MAAPTVPLPPALVAMMARGVSVIVGSRDAALRPSLMRAVGSRVEEGGAAVTVYLARPQADQLIEDIAASGHLAVVFSEPSTHRSVQLKATQVRMRPADAGDVPVLQAYLASMERELGLVGFPADLARTLLAHRVEDVVAVRFAPEQAFDQTPGPRAGNAIGSAA